MKLKKTARFAKSWMPKYATSALRYVRNGVEAASSALRRKSRRIKSAAAAPNADAATASRYSA